MNSLNNQLPTTRVPLYETANFDIQRNFPINKGGEVEIKRHWLILLRNKAIILRTWLITILIVILASFAVTPKYKSTAILYMWPSDESGQVSPTEAALVEKDSDASEVRAAKITAKGTLDAAKISRSISTMGDLYKVQAAFLKSKSLIREVISKLKLDLNPEFMSTSRSGDIIRAAANWLSDTIGLDIGINIESNYQYELMKFFAKSLVMDIPKNSSMVTISFTHKDSKLAHQIVEAIIESVINLTKKRYGTSNVHIIEPSKVADFSENYENISLNLGLAAAFGLVLGILSVILLVILGDRIALKSDIRRIFNLKLLSVIPEIKDLGTLDKAKLSTYGALRSAVSEVRSMIHTALSSTNNAIPQPVLHFTSASVGTGKTFLSAELAMAYAGLNAKVLMIDCNLQLPALHELFAIGNTSGLTNYLTGTTNYKDVVQQTEFPNLSIITSGTQVQNSADLMARKEMLELLSEAKQNFALIILDGPSMLHCADMLILSKLSDGTVIVIDAQNDRKKQLHYGIERLRDIQAPIIGAILNRCKYYGNEIDSCR